MATLEILIRSRLKRMDSAAEARINARVLADEAIRAGIEAGLDRSGFTFLLICLTNLSLAAHPGKDRYIELVVRRFRILFQAQGSDAIGMATVGTGFLALSKNAPAALEVLQDGHGAGGFLELIKANGTLFELFGILQRATPAFREDLLERLDEPTAAALVNKTIAAGRSIESFHFTLRLLHPTPALRDRLEQRVGIADWWRLIGGVGTLNSLSRIARAMSDAFRDRFIADSTRLAVEEWAAIIARGLFLNTCAFVPEELAAYPEASRTAFREALRRTAGPLAARATWFDLNPSKPPADPDSAEADILRSALRARIDSLQPAELEGLDFREAVNGLAFRWRERPDLRPVLARRLWHILPDPKEWPRKEGEIGAMRLVLTIARSGLIEAADALRLFDATVGFLDPEVCAEAYTLPLFLLLWNLAALRFERGPTRRVDGVFPTALSLMLTDRLRERVRPKGPNKEKLAQLALAALLHLADPSLGGQLRRLLEPIKGASKWLRQEAMSEVGSVPALFALEGIALLQPNEVLFPPMVRAALLSKCDAYDEIGPAIESLRNRVERAGRRR